MPPLQVRENPLLRIPGSVRHGGDVAGSCCRHSSVQGPGAGRRSGLPAQVLGLALSPQSRVWSAPAPSPQHDRVLLRPGVFEAGACQVAWAPLTAVQETRREPIAATAVRAAADGNSSAFLASSGFLIKRNRTVFSLLPFQETFSLLSSPVWASSVLQPRY